MLRTFISALAMALLAVQTHAEVYTWEQDSTEDQVKNSGMGDGSTDSTATGSSTITYDTDTKLLNYDVSWDGLENQLTKIHVHGPAGAESSNAAHLFNVFPEETDVIAAGVDRFTDSTSDTGKLRDFVLDTRSPFNAGVALTFMLLGRGYVNIHSSGFPMGEIRGNLVLTGGDLVSGTKAHRRCTARVNEAVDDVSAAEGKALARCVKRGTKGKLEGTIEECVAADVGDGVGADIDRAERRFEKKCHGFDDDGLPRYPFFGRPGGNDPEDPTGSSIAEYITRLTRDGEVAIVRDLFGDDLDAAVAQNDVDPDTARCQRAVLKQVQVCRDRVIGEFRRCVDLGLEGGNTAKLYLGADDPFDDTTDIEACFGFDGRGKIETACGTDLDAVAMAKCDAVDLEGAFPGCDEDTAMGLSACADAGVVCESCRALNAADDMSVDCDAADDDSENGSCEG